MKYIVTVFLITACFFTPTSHAYNIYVKCNPPSNVVTPLKWGNPTQNVKIRRPDFGNFLANAIAGALNNYAFVRGTNFKLTYTMSNQTSGF